MGDPGAGGDAFDFAFFDQYTSGDEALQREVLQLFFGQVVGLVADLDPEGSDQDWRAGAHAIKGGARGLGLNAVGDLCQHMENMKDPGAGERQAALTDLETALKAARQSVAAHYEGIFDT